MADPGNIQNKTKMSDNFKEIVVEEVRITKKVISRLKVYQSEARDKGIFDVETINLAILFLLDRCAEIKDEDQECLLAHMYELSLVAKHLQELS